MLPHPLRRHVALPSGRIANTAAGAFAADGRGLPVPAVAGSVLAIFACVGGAVRAPEFASDHRLKQG